MWPSATPGLVRVDGPRFHHLVRVLRVREGEQLEVFDGRGQRFAATVRDLQTEALTLEVGAAHPERPQRAFWVVQAMPKADKLELVLQKATELGAAGVALAWSERCVVKPSPRDGDKVERWRRIAEEAARQCGRAQVPQVLEPTPLLHAMPEGAAVLVLDEEERAVRLAEAFAQVPAEQPVAVVVGPEGGLARAEVDALRAQGAVSVSLGALVLRTETAALAALSVLRHLDGELG